MLITRRKSPPYTTYTPDRRWVGTKSWVHARRSHCRQRSSFLSLLGTSRELPNFLSALGQNFREETVSSKGLNAAEYCLGFKKYKLVFHNGSFKKKVLKYDTPKHSYGFNCIPYLGWYWGSPSSSPTRNPRFRV